MLQFACRVSNAFANKLRMLYWLYFHNLFHRKFWQNYICGRKWAADYLYFDVVSWRWSIITLIMCFIFIEICMQQGIYQLTNWGRDKMADISQTIFLKAFSWMKLYECRLILHWSLFLRVKLTTFRPGNKHYLNQWWLNYQHIYASLGLNASFNGRNRLRCVL